MSKNIVIGKQDLLHWAHQQSGVTPCGKYDDLKDGLIFLALLQQLFPQEVDNSVVKVQKFGPRNAQMNWELIKHVMALKGLPLHICDRRGIAAGHQRPCYNMLVLFYFMLKLSTSSDFSVDFAHPIDQALADFLQSPESLQCLAPGHRETVRSISPAHPVVSPGRKGAEKSEKADFFEKRDHNDNAVQQAGALQIPTHKNSEGPLGANISKMSMIDDLEAQEDTLVYTLKGELKAAKRQNDFLQAELEHVRQVSQHVVDRQKLLIQGEIQRATDQFQSQLVLERLNAQYEAKKIAQECVNELERVSADLKVQRSAMALPSMHPVELMYTELSHTKQDLRVAQGNLLCCEKAQEAAEHALADVERALEEQKEATRKILGTFEEVTERLKGSMNSSVVFDMLSPAEQAPLLLRIQDLETNLQHSQKVEKQLQEEIERLAHVSTLSTKERDFEESAELRAAKKENDKLKALNEYLKDQLKSGATASASVDYHATLLTEGIEIPSTMIGAARCEEIFATAWTALKQLQDDSNATMNVKQSVKELIMLCSAFNARLERSGRSLTTLYGMVQKASKDLTVARFSNQRALDDLRDFTRRETEKREAENREAIAETTLQLQLAQEEVEQVKNEKERILQRVMDICQTLKLQVDRAFSNSSTSIPALVAALEGATAREQLWQQLCGHLQEGKQADARSREILREIRKAEAPSADCVELLEAGKLLVARIQGSLIETTEALIASARELSITQEQVAESKLVRLRDEAAGNRDTLKVAELDSTCRLLRDQLEAAEDERNAAVAERDAERVALETLKKELTDYVDDLSSTFGSYRQQNREKDEFQRDSDEKHQPTKQVSLPTGLPKVQALPLPQSSMAFSPRIARPSSPEAKPQEKQSSVLSPGELEKRKMEILAKYGVT